jgi:uncharacterized membrane protein YgcG
MSDLLIVFLAVAFVSVIAALIFRKPKTWEGKSPAPNNEDNANTGPYRKPGTLTVLKTLSADKPNVSERRRVIENAVVSFSNDDIDTAPLLNPLNPLSPLNPLHFDQELTKSDDSAPEPVSHNHSHSHSSSDHSNHSSPSYDSGHTHSSHSSHDSSSSYGGDTYGGSSHSHDSGGGGFDGGGHHH